MSGPRDNPRLHPEPSGVPELLAPAGDIVAGLTALRHGADAVYAGLPKFNARERKDNLSLDDMAALIAHARPRGKKVYVTLNTLIKESELEEVAAVMSDLDDLAPDALIIQDLGVVHLARNYFPNLKLHASTQMGIHNAVGVEFAAALGMERVILERQVTLDELEIIVRKSPIEIEVFIHGALCCGLAGQCLLSSWMGGWSGNRGKCKQPCRRRYFAESGNGFFLSTKDLYSLDLVPRLRKIGVASLKIEGRLRRPDYVRSVVESYRMVLDVPPGEERATLKRARGRLSHSCGRKWSFGFASEKEFDQIIQHDVLGVSGLLCGKIVRVADNGFKVSLTRPVKINDRLRIQSDTGDDGPTLTVTRLTVDGQRGDSARRGQNCFVHCDKDVPNGALVYKIGEEIDAPVPEARERFRRRRRPVDLTVHLDAQTLHVRVRGLPSPLEWSSSINASPAKNQPLTHQHLIETFTATRSDFMAAGSIEVHIDGSLFVPASSLKTARRAFWTWLEGAVDVKELESSGQIGLRRFLEDHRRWRTESNRYSKRRPVYLLGAQRRAPVKNGLRAREIFGDPGDADQIVIPSFCPETRLDALADRVAEARQAGRRTFRATSWHGLEILKRIEDAEIIASFPLPACNSAAVRELRGLGVAEVQAWVELEKTEIENLVRHSPLPVEVYRLGRLPLLVTRAKLPAAGDIREFRGKRFRIEADPATGLTSVYPNEVFAVPRVPGTSDFFDLLRAGTNERTSSSFNFDLELR